jgi:3-deoxy-7-phosphoheptulonate synthase
VTEDAARTVYQARETIKRILRREDERLLVVIGPCSIHDCDAATEFAQRLSGLRGELGEALFIVMRVYFEKPRTTVGWKGLINDPGLDDSFRINDGLHIARRLLADLNGQGIPCGTEFLDPITPAYIADLVSWGAIGARTTESQTHRELASGLSCPVGFKNGTDGNVQVAIDAVRAAARRHHFLGVTKTGRSAIIATDGNPDCHVILRGGRDGPNYDLHSTADAATKMHAAGITTNIMVDCSHANSGKDPERQLAVCGEVAANLGAGDRPVIGVMLEANLHAGRQDLGTAKTLAYGVSITDACAGIDDAARSLSALAEGAARARNKR